MNEQELPPGQEKRLTFRLLSYWQRIRGDRTFPALGEIDISAITEMWHHCFTIEVGDTLDECRFQNFGPELCQTFGVNHAGEPVLDALAHDPKLEHTIGFFPDVLKRREPVADSGEFYMEGDEVRYRSLIVPLSTNGTDIDYLLGTTNYRIFPKA